MILQPASGAFTVNLSETRRYFGVEWFAPDTGQSTMAASLAGGTIVTMVPPFVGPAVVYLKGR